jgi:hypothetical protein
MPCVIILRDSFYDIIVHADGADSLDRLYTFGCVMDASGEAEAPLNINIFEMTRELWVTSCCMLFDDMAEFYKNFPNRDVPMVLNLEQAETIDWSQGIVYAGIRYFGARALNLDEDQELLPMAENRDNINDFNLLKHYMNTVAGRQ